MYVIEIPQENLGQICRWYIDRTFLNEKPREILSFAYANFYSFK